MRFVEVKGNKQTETSVKKTDEKPEVKQEQKAKEEKKEVHRCGQCKWYDVSTQRDFHRDGIRKGLVEVRAVCRSPTARAKGHLVKNDSGRPCFEEGVYVKPQKQKKETKETKDEKKTSPSEYHGPPLTDVEKNELKKNKKKRSKRPQLKRGDKVIVTDPQNGETKTFEQKGRRLVLVKQ